MDICKWELEVEKEEREKKNKKVSCEGVKKKGRETKKEEGRNGREQTRREWF